MALTKELQLKIKLMAVSKQLASSESRETIRESIIRFLDWYKSDANALNRKIELKDKS